MSRLRMVLVLVTLVGAGCEQKDAHAPSPPDPLPNSASLIPTAPAPQPTATPTPGGPEDEPLPAIPGDGDSGSPADCGEPIPPPLARINVKVHIREADRVTLDSTPLVGPDSSYCRAIGYTDGRSYCPVRLEGDPERLACEAARIGRASDTGRIGPTWTANGRPCQGAAAGASCQNHPNNQFLVFAYGEGTFRACSSGGVCGEVSLP
jgi:hypothetical protein